MMLTAESGLPDFAADTNNGFEKYTREGGPLLVGHHPGKGRTGVEVREQAVKDQLLIKAVPQERNDLEQSPHSMLGEVAGFTCHQDLLRESQSIEGQQSQTWRTVQDHVVILRAHPAKRLAQTLFSARLPGQLLFQGTQENVRRKQIQAVIDFDPSVLDRHLDLFPGRQHFVQGPLQPFGIDSKPQGGMALRVQVHQQHLPILTG